MPYIAIKQIGEYKPGDEVPAEKAELWLKMYREPQVELREESKVEKHLAPATLLKESKKEEEEKENPFLDNYLAQNARSVIKALEEDDLEEKTLKKLLSLEKDSKSRKSVIEAIEDALDA